MNLKKAFKGWVDYQNTVRELSALSNRELNDLGITRSEIAKIARNASSNF